jgi:enoyl-CoA hydratase
MVTGAITLCGSASAKIIIIVIIAHGGGGGTVVRHPFEPELAIERRGAVHLVTLDRPESLNAVDLPMHRALQGVWHFLGDDPDVRAIVVTGRGRAFSAGGNLDHIVDLQRDRTLRRKDVEQARAIVVSLVDCPVPVIAAVNGPAVGLGCSIAIMADLVYMAESAYLADPHVAIGLTAGDGGAAMWPVLTSMLQAKEFLYTGDRIPASEAVRMGLATRAFPDEDVVPSALAMGERLAALPRQALETTKRAVNMHLRRTALEVLDFALSCEYESFDTPEHHARIEGLRTRMGRESR